MRASTSASVGASSFPTDHPPDFNATLSCSWASAIQAGVCPLILLPTPPSEEGGRPDKKL